LTVADWVYRHGEAAGRGTDTLPAAKLRYMPLKTVRGVLGVLGVRGPQSDAQQLTLEQLRLVESFASQAALALGRSRADRVEECATLDFRRAPVRAKRDTRPRGASVRRSASRYWLQLPRAACGSCCARRVSSGWARPA